LQKNLESLKEMHLQTNLVTNKKANCVILSPEDDEHLRIAEILAGYLQEFSDVSVPIVNSAAPRTQHVIALGQMINNPLIERLYWNRYVFLDSLWPGEGGSVIQTVHNPYPWNSGQNVLVLGGSDPQGVLAAVENLLTHFDKGTDITVPPLLDVQLPPSGLRNTQHTVLGQTYSSVKIPNAVLSPHDIETMLADEPAETLLAFQEYAVKYLLTGEIPYIQAGSRVLIRMCELYEKDPDRKMTWPEETNSRYIFAMWDAVEESEIFSNQDRLRITNMLLSFLLDLVPLTSNYENIEEDASILWNHTTFPLLGLYFGGRYFQNYYGMKETEIFLSKASAAFAGQEQSWKPQCDADSYLTLTMGHMIEYALAEATTTFFEAGHLEAYADYLIGISDNEGRASGFGDSSLQLSNTIPLAGVPYAFWYTRDPGYLSYLDSICDGSWPNPYHQNVKPVAPDKAGLQVFPLSPPVYAYTISRPYYNECSGPPNVPLGQSFDKIAFRADNSKKGQYFLLDGYGRGKHYHYDTNAILKFTQSGIDWLIDADYLVRNTTEHNMVSVVCDGRVDVPVPECAALISSAETPGYGFTETVVRDYNNTDWHRIIFWKKGDWVVIMDRMHALTTASFSFDAIWKVLNSGTISMEGNPCKLTIERQGRPELGGPDSHIFTLQNASLATGTLRGRIGTAGSIQRLVQRHHLKLGKAQVFSIQNLLHVTDDKPTGLTLEKLDENTAYLRNDNTIMLGCGSYHSQGLQIEGTQYHLSEQTVVLAGTTRFQCGDIFIASKKPLALEIDVPTGGSWLTAHEQTDIERRGGSPLRIRPGTHKINLTFGKKELQILSNVLSAGQTITDGPPKRIREVTPPVVELGQLWSKEPEAQPEEIRDAVCWRVSENIGEPENYLICQGKKLKCYDPSGAILWTFTAKDLIRCVTVADIDGDGIEEILCGGNDEHIYLLNKNGHLQKKHRMTEKLIVGQGGTVNPCVNSLLADDFGDPGNIRIVAGCTNSQISMFDLQFNRIWNRGGMYHGVREIRSSDLQNDGCTSILAADHYGSVHNISSEGEYAGRIYSELGDVVFDIGDINGDGKLEVMNGSSTGTLVASDPSYNHLWEFNTHGYNIRQVLCMDLDNDGRSESLVGSDTGYVYALDAKGRIIWQTQHNSAVTNMAMLYTNSGKGRFAVALANGETVICNERGQKVARHVGSAPVKALLPVVSADESWRLLIVDCEERIRVVS